MINRLSALDIPGRLEGILPRGVVEAGVALACLGLVVLVRLAIDLAAPGVVPFSLLFPAILLATLVAGWRSGLMVAGLGGLLAWYFIVPPQRSFDAKTTGDAASLALFLFSAGLVTILAEGFRDSTAAIRESEARFRRVAEEAPVKLWMVDAAGAPLYFNHTQRAFWGLEENDVAAFDWLSTVEPEDVEAVRAAFARALAEPAPFEIEARCRRADGEVRILAMRAQPRTSRIGAFLGMIGVNVDVTEAHRAQSRQRLLLNELNHRVKNTLASVQSLAHQTLRGKAPPDALDTFGGRLIALSKAHDILTLEDWEAALLSDLVARVIQPHESPGAVRFDVEGEAVRLGPRAVLALAMALHELATNAVKYGALSTDEGRVGVTWRMIDATTVELTWRETGGPPVSKTDRRGFGTRLLKEGLAGDLGAAPSLNYDPAGLVCIFTAPVASEPADEASS